MRQSLTMIDFRINRTLAAARLRDLVYQVVYLTILALFLRAAPISFAADYVLIIGGAAGEKSFYDAFWRATSQFHQLLTDEYAYDSRHITFLFEDMGDSESPGLVDAESRRDPILTAFAQLTDKIQPSDRFLLFMIGHASRTGGNLRFNLMGQDINETEYVTLINGIRAENQILIFGFPYSGKLVPQLSAPGRVILTSSSPNEGYSLQAGFGKLFADAFSTAAADLNSDGAISLLESFLFVERRTKEWYEDFGTIQAEHPYLDDNADGKASRNLIATRQEAIDDGTFADQTFLGERLTALPSPPPDLQVPDDAVLTEAAVPEDFPVPTVRTYEEGSSDLPYTFITEADEKTIRRAINDAPSQKAYPEDGAVVLWEGVEIDIDEKSRYIYSTRRVVKIFNENGRDLAEVSIPYMRGRDDVTIHHARTLTPGGDLVELDTSDVVTDLVPPSAVEAGLYVDARLMYFALPDVTDGCVIDYAYSTNNLGHVMQGEFWRKVYFQARQPVEYYRLTVHIPKKKELYYQIAGAPAGSDMGSFLTMKPEITESNYARTYVFEARDVPPLKEEYLMPAPQDLAYSISLSSIDSWDKLVTWYATLIREQDTLTPEIAKKTEELLKGAWSHQEKVKRLYEYVATNIQYLGYELGIWAIKPRPADSVLKDGQGDCKDKTTLLSTMLASAGINAYPVLISAGDTRGINAHLPGGGSEVKAVPSLAYFNHMILAVKGSRDDELIWLDPTSETCAFGDFPAGDQDRWTLIINPQFLTGRTGSRTHATEELASKNAEDLQNRLYLFQKSPSLDATSNLKRVHTDVQLKKDLSVSVRQELTVTGSFNTRLRSQLARLDTAEERSEFMHSELELDDRAKIIQFKTSNLSQLEKELKVEVTWTCEEYLYAIGSQFVLELPLVKHPYAELLSEESRLYSAILGKALSLEDKVSVSTEAPFRIDTVPEEQTLKTEVAEVQLRYMQSKRRAEMHQIVRFLTPTVTPRNIEHLKEVVRVASNRGTKRFILTQ